MKEYSEQKLIQGEDSLMEVPDSDGENMPDVKYEFNTKQQKTEGLTVTGHETVNSTEVRADKFFKDNFYANVLIADDEKASHLFNEHFNYISQECQST
jgi:hypothetical protein